MSGEAMRFPVLIGDIGGTNARFAMLPDAGAPLVEFPIVATAAYPNIDDAILGAILSQTPLRPHCAVLAVAAPITGDEIELTNCPWVVRPRRMHETLGLDEVLLLNDFEAQALAVVSLGPDSMEKTGGCEPVPAAGRVVLGPGTGLGVAGIVHSRGVWIPVPGEGGHVDVGPRSRRDEAIFPHLEPIEGRISGEQLLCGRGLVNIYRAVCLADGQAPTLASPAEVTAAAALGSDRHAQEAITLFVTYLGRVAGDMALIFMAKGGVYLTGGIAQKIVPALRSGPFRENFEDKAPHSQLMRAMPSYVITHPLAALAGLAAYARAPGGFGVETAGRRWSRL